MPLRSIFTKNCLGILLILILSTSITVAEQSPVGKITGQVVDVDTRLPLATANIVLVGTEYGSSTDLDGNFTIYTVPVGSYVLQCSYLGYNPIMITDVIVKSNRITTVEVELKASAIRTDEVTVKAKPQYFVEGRKQPVSVVSVTNEEIRRASGTAGDVNRIIMALPSVAKVNDTRNALIVRGGSPAENGYFIDNIPIPNINHYPAQGASNGAMSVINVDFIKDVRFYSGGFTPVSYTHLTLPTN